MRQQDIINAPPSLTEETFAELFATCKPRARSSDGPAEQSEEPWTEVNWLGELWEGRQQAAREGKPIFHLGDERTSPWMRVKQWRRGPCARILQSPGRSAFE